VLQQEAETNSSEANSHDALQRQRRLRNVCGHDALAIAAWGGGEGHGLYVAWQACTGTHKCRVCVCVYSYVRVCVCVRGLLLANGWVWQDPGGAAGEVQGLWSLHKEYAGHSIAPPALRLEASWHRTIEAAANLHLNLHLKPEGRTRIQRQRQQL